MGDDAMWVEVSGFECGLTWNDPSTVGYHECVQDDNDEHGPWHVCQCGADKWVDGDVRTMPLKIVSGMDVYKPFMASS